MELDHRDSEFLHEIGITIKQVENSGLSVDVLRDIVKDYKCNELTLLDEAEYIAKKIQRCNAVHSVRWRIKSPSHLIKKIIRKLTEDNPSEKYQGINSGNYKGIITDLIGVRAIYLFKSDWQAVHDHILSRWVIKENEPVTIYHREGDIMDIYKDHNDCERKIHVHNYRSIHYVVPATNIQSVQVYCEIQTRTIFEEGWSEIDHQVRYPDFSDDENLMSYLTIFNRLAGSADEMGSYVNDLVELIRKNKELEGERFTKESQFNSEKIKLEAEIKELSMDKKNIDKMKNAYEKLIEVQNNELISLKEVLKSQTNETIRLNRQKEPVVKVIYQKNKTNSNTECVGEVKIEVMRSNDLASFAIHFDPKLTGIPIVDVKAISTNCEFTEPSDLKIKTGGGKSSDFNIHMQNEKIGYLERGEYVFEFSAKVI